MTRTLQIVGAGKAGRTLARLWHEAGQFCIGTVVNQTLASSQSAVAFIGAGQAAAELNALKPIDVLLIAASDRALPACAEQIALEATALPGAIAFHLSGSVPSEALAPLRTLGCAVASLHPICSFAEPARSVTNFAGAFCAVEGDAAALPVLHAAAAAIGARCVSLDARQKSVYHAGSVFASNYVTTMLGAGVRCLKLAGIAEEQAVEMLCQIAQGTVGNVAQLGPAQALTGPIARGEVEVVERQLSALSRELPELAESYRAAGLLAVELARTQGHAAQQDLAQIEALLRSNSPRSK